MAFALKLPFIGRRAEADADEQAPAQVAQKRAGGMSTGRKLQFLIAALVVLLAVDGVIVALDARQGTFGTLYIASVGKIQMLSQRLAKAAQQASQGNVEAFKQLRESREEFASLMKLLSEGGQTGSTTLPATSSGPRPALDVLDKEWKKTERNATLVSNEQANLVALGNAVRSINASNPTLLELADEIAAMSVQSGGSARQNAITAQLVMLTQRMAKNANTMLASDIVDPEVAFLLGKDTNTFRDTLQGLLSGSEALRIVRVGDAEMRGKLSELEGGFKEYQRAVSDILGNMQRLVNAKRATRDIFNDSEALLRASAALSERYEVELAGRQTNFVVLIAVSLLAFGVLLLIGKVYVDDSRKRAEESERMNRDNQEAILRLLDEIGNLANGDLTVRAKVTEDITGAIADSINYTIDELRRLVAGITEASTQVTAATQEASAVDRAAAAGDAEAVDRDPGRRPVGDADGAADDRRVGQGQRLGEGGRVARCTPRRRARRRCRTRSAA